MEPYQGDNAGGILSLQIIAHYNVVTLNPLKVLPGTEWTDIPFKEESGQFDPTEKDSDNGTIYGYRGRFFFHRMRDEVTATMKPFIGQKSIIRIKDMNKRTYIIGAPGQPVKITSSGTTGQAYANENGIEYNFEIEQPEEAIITD